MRDWLKTVGAIVAAIGLVGGLVLWSHGQLRADIRDLNSRVTTEIGDIRERLARIEGHLGISPQPAQ